MLYYAKKQKDVLKSMKTSLVENGILLVSAPSEPHEMVNFVNQIKKFLYLNTLKFFQNVLLPFLKKEKFKLLFELKTNVIKFDKKDEFIEFWKNTTYYNKMIEEKVYQKLEARSSLKFKKISAVVCSVKKEK